MGQLVCAEIQHGDAMTKNPTLGIDFDRITRFGRGDSRQPLQGTVLIQLDAKAVG